MSTKLNAEELAAKAWPDAWIVADQSVIDHSDIRTGYASAIVRVAQPIADERDKLREVLGDILYWIEEGLPLDEASTPIKDAERILAKYPKP